MKEMEWHSIRNERSEITLAENSVEIVSYDFWSFRTLVVSIFGYSFVLAYRPEGGRGVAKVFPTFRARVVLPVGVLKRGGIEVIWNFAVLDLWISEFQEAHESFLGAIAVVVPTAVHTVVREFLIIVPQYNNQRDGQPQRPKDEYRS